MSWIVVADVHGRRQWVREEDLAKELKLHATQLRKIIRHFEEQNLIMRDHRKETAKGAKMYSVAVAATTGGRAEDKIVVAVKKILYATDANESALEDAEEYLNQSLGVEAEDEENGEQEGEEEKTQA